MSFESNNNNQERLQKIIAQAGLASRREAEDLISEGQVTVNGKTAKLGDKATLGVDAIKVKGKLIQTAQNKVYYLFYKPKNVIAMINEDEEGRPTIKDFTGSIKERVFTVGRMDFTGEGAILLTNDGEMAQKITKSNDLLRRYHVKVDRHPTQDDLARIARGGRIEKVSMNPHHVRVVQEYAKNALIEVSFQGSGATEVRKFFENKGFMPEKVVRVGIGHLKAEKMKPGEIRKVDATSMEAMFTQPELAEKLISNLVKDKAKRTEIVAGEDKEKRASRRPPRNRPKPAERAARGTSRARSDDGDFSADEGFKPRFKKSFGSERKSFGDRKPSFGRGAPRGEDGLKPRFKKFDGERSERSFGERKSFGDRKPSFGDRKPFGERKSFGDRKPSFGDRKPFGERKSFGDRKPSFGDRKPFGERKSFGDRKPAFGDRKPFGERKSFGDRKPSFGAERGERKSFGDRKPSFGAERGERKSFGDRKPSFGAERGERKSFGDRKPSFGDRKPFGERKSFGDRKPAFGAERGERKSFGDRKPSLGRGAPRGGSARSGASRGTGFKPRFK